MPNYKTHLFAGTVTFACLLLVMRNFNPNLFTALQWLCCCLIGSLFPDIDTKSKIQKVFYIFLLIIFITLTIKNKTKLFVPLSFIGITPLIVNHRGIFHNLWFIIAIGIAIVFIVSIYSPNQTALAANNVIFFIAGAFSHLWLDLGIKKTIKI